MEVKVAHRELSQLSLADGIVHGLAGSNARLERIDDLLDWSAFEARLSVIYSARKGRPSYPPLTMFKGLLLQQWYGLSDPGLEEALGDRLSFRRFCGLALDQAAPDHSTISRFRKQLARHDLSGALFEELGRQLDAKRLIVRQGTLIDATLVAAQAKKPPFGKEGGGTVDRDANWTRRGNKNHFGYKAHIAVDQGSGLIRRQLLTPASVNDTVPADALIIGDEAAVYADKAYDSHARRARLRAAGIKDRIMHRANKHHPAVPRWQARRNKLIAPIRAAVEGVFGTMKRSYGYRRARYFNLTANAVHLDLLCIAINLRRAEVLTR
jgi:IS5 family transposase